MAGYDVETVDVGGVDGLFDIGVVNDTLVERAVHLLDVYAQSARSVGLWVGIYHQHGFL